MDELQADLDRLQLAARAVGALWPLWPRPKKAARAAAVRARAHKELEGAQAKLEAKEEADDAAAAELAALA